jgi:membrane protein
MATSRATPKARRSIQQMKNRMVEQVMETELDELTRVKRWFHSALKIVVMVWQDFFQNLVKLQAMALAFKTLLSLAPLLAVLFSILKAFGVHNRMEPALAEALAPLGEKGREITVYLIGFVDKMSAGALGTVGLAALFITVLSLMDSIEDGFNHIWRARAARTLTRKFSDYLSAILVGPVLVFAAVTITATLQNSAIVRALLSLEGLGKLLLILLQLVPYLTLWGAFTFVYVFIPNTRVRLRSAAVGGLIAAILWQSVGWGFAKFVASSTQYYAIYSSFAILLLFLLWLYIGWVIVLLGAQVAYAHQHIFFFQGDRQFLAQSQAGREKLALHTLHLVGRNFYYGLDPMTVTELAMYLRIPGGIAKEFLEMLAEARLVLPVNDGDTYVLGRDPETISIKAILDCVRNSGRKAKVPEDRSPEEDEIDDLLAAIDLSTSQALEGKSLQTLILSLPPPEAQE